MFPKKGRISSKNLKPCRKNIPTIGQVDGLGMALRIEMCQEDGLAPNRDLADAIMNIGLGAELTAGGKKRGLVLDIGGYYKNVFTLAPSLYMTEEEIDLSVILFEEALQKALNK